MNTLSIRQQLAENPAIYDHDGEGNYVFGSKEGNRAAIRVKEGNNGTYAIFFDFHAKAKIFTHGKAIRAMKAYAEPYGVLMSSLAYVGGGNTLFFIVGEDTDVVGFGRDIEKMFDALRPLYKDVLPSAEAPKETPKLAGVIAEFEPTLLNVAGILKGIGLGAYEYKKGEAKVDLEITCVEDKGKSYFSLVVLDPGKPKDKAEYKEKLEAFFKGINDNSVTGDGFFSISLDEGETSRKDLEALGAFLPEFIELF